MNAKLSKEIKALISSLKLSLPSYNGRLTKQVIQEFADKVDWYYISEYQRLSEDFIREFADKVDWDWISEYQRLSEDFIREFKDRVSWRWISEYQTLSEDFIREFVDRVNWEWISKCQRLSEDSIREFADRIDIDVYREVNVEKTLAQKLEEIKQYSKAHDLEFDGQYLYCYRNHDKYGRGSFKSTTRYVLGEYYHDWHCDMRPEENNSFGFGIWPKGNTKVKVKVEDWGVAVTRGDGKARVWGFEAIG